MLLGGFYAAVTVGISISFGILDIVNIAHPAFIILGSYIAYIVNTRLGLDPILVSLIMLPVFYALGAGGLPGLLRIVRAARPRGAERARVLLRPAVHHRGAADPGVRRRLPLRRGALYRAELAHRRDGLPAAHAGAVRGGARDVRRRCSSISRSTFIGRAISAVAQDQLALQLMAAIADPHQAHRLRHLDRDGVDRRRAADHHPAGRALGRPRIYRPRVRDLRARRARQPARHADRRDAARHRRKLHVDLLWAVLGAGGGVRASAAHAGLPAERPSRTIGLAIVQTRYFLLIAVAVAAIVFFAARWVNNDYVFFAGYTVLQFIVLATAWNILGGYTGYVNFGSAAFFAMGAYTTVVLPQALPAADPDPDRDRRHRLRHRRARHGLPDAAAARRVLRDRDAGARGRAADHRRQLELRRRRARRLRHPAERDRVHRPLHPVPVPGDARARGDRARRSRAASSARSSATASPPSATTNSRPRPPACRRCSSS